MNLAADLLLLLMDDDSGKPVVEGTQLDLALAGAVMLDLVTAGRLDVSGPGEEVRPGRLVVRDASPVEDAVLDAALQALVGRRPAKPKDALPVLRKGLRPRLLDALVARGILRAEEGRVLGVFPTHRWPAVDSAHEDRVRAGLVEVLVSGRDPQPREAALVSLLFAVDRVAKVLGDAGAGLGGRELKRRAKAVADGEFAGAAVRQAVQAAQAAVVASVAAVTAATSAS
jgi:hypothetical protein